MLLHKASSKAVQDADLAPDAPWGLRQFAACLDCFSEIGDRVGLRLSRLGLIDDESFVSKPVTNGPC